MSRTDVNGIDLSIAKDMPITARLTSNTDRARIVSGDNVYIQWKAESEIATRFEVTLGRASSLFFSASATLLVGLLTTTF